MPRTVGQSAFRFGAPAAARSGYKSEPTYAEKRFAHREVCSHLLPDDCALCAFKPEDDCAWCNGTRKIVRK